MSETATKLDTMFPAMVDPTLLTDVELILELERRGHSRPCYRCKTHEMYLGGIPGVGGYGWRCRGCLRPTVSCTCSQLNALLEGS